MGESIGANGNHKLQGSFSRLSEAAQGRLLVAAAACFWSVSGVFVTLLHAEHMPATVIAAYRSLYAGAALCIAWTVSLLLRRKTRHVAPAAEPIGMPRETSSRTAAWDWRMLSMVACFTLMTHTFISSMVMTNPANSVLLQYSATIWIVLAGVLWLGEPADGRNIVAVVGGLTGVGVLIAGGWQSGPNDRLGIIYGLLSGAFYAGVVVHLRALRRFESLFLASLNHIGAGVILWFVMVSSVESWRIAVPEAVDMGKLMLFGTLQMGLPYFLFGLGIKRINSQEAGLLTLIEPLLNPLWTFLFAGVATPPFTVVGGTILLGTLCWRFLGRRGLA